MGFFDIFKKKKEIKDEVTETKTTVNLSKKIDLSKKEVKISLEKKNVEKLVAEVQLVIDVSGSMDENYYKGYVQECLNRIIPIALTFDDDGVVPVYAFNDETYEMNDLTLNNLENYSEIFLENIVGGGTEYAPSLKKILNKAKKNQFKFPAFVLFITDGDNFDKKETEKMIKELSYFDIYIQFIGIGNDSFSFLRKLDNLSDRQFDNAGFINFKDFKKFNDKNIYDELLKEFVEIYKQNTFKSGKIDLKKY